MRPPQNAAEQLLALVKLSMTAAAQTRRSRKLQAVAQWPTPSRGLEKRRDQLGKEQKLPRQVEQGLQRDGPWRAGDHAGEFQLEFQL